MISHKLARPHLGATWHTGPHSSRYRLSTFPFSCSQKQTFSDTTGLASELIKLLALSTRSEVEIATTSPLGHEVGGSKWSNDLRRVHGHIGCMIRTPPTAPRIGSITNTGRGDVSRVRSRSTPVDARNHRPTIVLLAASFAIRTDPPRARDEQC